MQIGILNLNHFLHAAGGKARFACKSFVVAKISTDWTPAFMKENFHNFRTSDDIDMKLEPVTKLGKRNNMMSKKFKGDVMSENCEAIVNFSIYGQLEPSGSRIPDANL